MRRRAAVSCRPARRYPSAVAGPTRRAPTPTRETAWATTGEGPYWTGMPYTSLPPIAHGRRACLEQGFPCDRLGRSAAARERAPKVSHRAARAALAPHELMELPPGPSKGRADAAGRAYVVRRGCGERPGHLHRRRRCPGGVEILLNPVFGRHLVRCRYEVRPLLSALQQGHSQTSQP